MSSETFVGTKNGQAKYSSSPERFETRKMIRAIVLTRRKPCHCVSETAHYPAIPPKNNNRIYDSAAESLNEKKVCLRIGREAARGSELRRSRYRKHVRKKKTRRILAKATSGGFVGSAPLFRRQRKGFRPASQLSSSAEGSMQCSPTTTTRMGTLQYGFPYRRAFRRRCLRRSLTDFSCPPMSACVAGSA